MPEDFQYDVFLSHSSKDKSIVRPLAERLRKDGLRVWFDEWEIQSGDNIPSRLEEGLERSRVLVLCMSANAFGSDWAQLESGTYRFRDPLNKLRRFIPLKLEDAQVKGSLAQFRYISWLPEVREQEYSKLLESCRPPANPAPSIQPQQGMNLWNVSHDQNPVFTGRSEFLQVLREDLVTKGRQAIYGLGGIGKSQIALEYAYRNRANYKAVFWTFADSDASISTDFIKIAKQLNLIVQDLPEQAVIVGAVKRWLESNDGWLLIFDNAENADTVRPFLPHAGHGHILITARWPRFQTIQIMNPRGVKVLPPDAARQFFLRRTGRDSSWIDSSSHDVELAEELGGELGFFPLALEQAGAFIAEHQTSFEDYLKSYRKRRLELLSQHAPVLGDYKDTVATTWAINFAEVEKSPASADLLRFSAFLWPEMVPLELFEKGGAELGDRLAPYLASVQSDPILLDQLLKPLMDYSLISRTPQTRSYSIHLLVQEVLQSRMPTAEKKFWMEAVVRAVSEAFPEGEFKNWTECERLLSQALLCKKYILENGFESIAAAHLLRHAGFYLHKRAQFSEAQAMYQIALAMREEIQGSEHPDTADSLGKLGLLYSDQAKYAEAENLLQRALEIREKVLGPEHRDTATSANDLAGLYLTLAKFGEAEALFRRALSVREKALEAGRAEIAESMKDLGHLLQAKGKYSEAEPLYRQALAISEKTLGSEHPDTANALNFLAWLLKNEGKYSEAEPLCGRALAIVEKTLGPEHPDTATALNSLATLLEAQGKYYEAEPLCRRALRISESAFGPEHPRTGAAINSLAGLLDEQGKHSEAEPLHRRALALAETALGPAHPDTAAGLNNLARSLQEIGKYSEAEPLYRQALDLTETVLGSAHPNTAASLDNLALLLQEDGKYGEAEPLCRRALEIRETVLGSEHPDTATSLNNLALLFHREEKYDKAGPLYRRTLEISEKTLGAEHPGTATTLSNMAELLRDEGKYGQAELLFRRALAIREKAFDRSHPDIARSLLGLASVHRRLGNNKKAKGFEQRARKIQRKKR